MDNILCQHILLYPQDSEKFECIPCTRGGSAYNVCLIKNITTRLSSERHRNYIKDEKLNEELINEVNRVTYGESTAKDPNDTQNSILNSKDTSSLLDFDIAQFIVDNNLPYCLVDNLVPFLKKIEQNPSSNAVMNCRASRKIVTRIASYCICESIRDQIIQELITTPFSIAMDESTDAFGCSYLAIHVKCLPQSVDAAPKVPKIRFISIIELEEEKSAETIYNKLKEEFFSEILGY